MGQLKPKSQEMSAMAAWDTSWFVELLNSTFGHRLKSGTSTTIKINNVNNNHIIHMAKLY